MFDRIRAVSFDLDNTLWDVVPVIARAEERLHAWLRERCSRIVARHTIETMRAARVELAASMPDRAHDVTWLRRESLARHIAEFGYEAGLADEAFSVFLAARHEIEFYEDVRPALERLRARYVLATLTNGNADLHRIGVGDWFDVRLTARDCGAAKPDPRAFERLAADMRLEPGEILHVGDDPLADVEGARAAGLHTVWVDRGYHEWPADIAPAEWRVSHLGEIAERLERGH